MPLLCKVCKNWSLHIMCYKSLCISEHLRDFIANSFCRNLRFLRKLLGLKIVVMNLFDKYDVWTNGQTYGRMGQGDRDACASKNVSVVMTGPSGITTFALTNVEVGSWTK